MLLFFNMRSFNSWNLKWTFEELQVFNSLVQTSQSERCEHFWLVKTKYFTHPLCVRRHSTKLNTQCSHQLFMSSLKIEKIFIGSSRLMFIYLFCKEKRKKKSWCLFLSTMQITASYSRDSASDWFCSGRNESCLSVFYRNPSRRSLFLVYFRK